MRKKYEALMNSINEGKYTGREIILAGMVLFLTGALFGVFFSPKKHQVIGSNNRNNGSNNGPTTNHNQGDKENMEMKKSTIVSRAVNGGILCLHI